MKAVIVTESSSISTLTRLVRSLEELKAGEIIVAGRSSLKRHLADWHEKECGRFSAPLTFRFYNGNGHSHDLDPAIRLLRCEQLNDSVLLVSQNGGIPADLSGLKKVIYLYPYLPLIGVRKPGHTPVRGAFSMGDRNQITRFSSTHERLENEWEPAGVYYFPARFLSDGIPAFVNSRTTFRSAFESFLSWSIRNFKIYAHVFAAHPGL